MPAYDVVAAGHLCLDIIPPFAAASQAPARLLQPGKLLHVGPAVLSTGGAVSNTGIALRKQGCRVAFMAQVGDDAFGRIIIAKMAEWGGVDGIAVDAEHGSSYSIVIAPPGVDRIFLHHPGCNDFFNTQRLHWEIIQAARIFHLGYPPLMRSLYADDGQGLGEMLARIKALGVTTSLDMAMPDPDSEAGRRSWRSWLHHVMPHVDFFLPSIDEMLLLWDRKAWEKCRQRSGSFVEAVALACYREIAAALLALGCGVVILKAGPRGMYCRSNDAARLRSIPLLAAGAPQTWAHREIWAAAFQSDSIQSAAGAGDAAAAGILVALLHGKSLEETLQFGNCLGWQNLRALDTVSGIGTLAETLALLPALPVHAPPFLDENWHATAARGVWERSPS
ncbi:MAG: carbohydrate kinase family protein [candidate division KSB1 bacterium]|nr:carbohydrate kinase family protein [candidate division KSB1 bacterium]MDZ7276231.1 carbohydrate kinase family protein [candidate division KSB1 bacterium]MDZ7287963.1 carbohydrate kinase family protein [candidate division KSB1 bacterium]MDZ7300024.1 carbohydrate kinase family protein [candidate division KSB1 bacterium]MDZ7308555.1 carbohydrate kinase family protein [candidate division KSB1 bacterium]